MSKSRETASACSGWARASPAASHRRRCSPPGGSRSSAPPSSPGTGRDPLLILSKQPDAHGAYPVALAGGGSGDGGGDDDGGGGPVGFFALFDERAVDAMNVLAHLLRSPESLAFVLEAVGSVALERCGAILDERVAADGAGDPE